MTLPETNDSTETRMIDLTVTSSASGRSTPRSDPPELRISGGTPPQRRTRGNRAHLAPQDAQIVQEDAQLVPQVTRQPAGPKLTLAAITNNRLTSLEKSERQMRLELDELKRSLSDTFGETLDYEHTTMVQQKFYAILDFFFSPPSKRRRI